MSVNELLKVWTDCSFKMLDNKYIPERIETFATAIHNLSKVGISELVIYRVEDDGITVRYKNRGSKSFTKVHI